jgi:hypothetical protein
VTSSDGTILTANGLLAVNAWSPLTSATSL